MATGEKRTVVFANWQDMTAGVEGMRRQGWISQTVALAGGGGYTVVFARQPA